MWRSAAGALIALTVLCAPGFAAETQNAPTFGKSLPPVGYVRFCATNQEECRFNISKAEKLTLDTEKWDQLSQVNAYVNGKIKPVSDQDQYKVAELWTYPVSAGDCEDYVLLKKRYLLGMGFSPSDMLITVLLDEKGDGHAVLTLVTDKGDYILDNRRNEVLRWDQTGYKFLKRQSQQDAKQWVSLRKAPATQVIVGTK